MKVHPKVRDALLGAVIVTVSLACAIQYLKWAFVARG
jgi:hypothetical protein